MNDRRACTSGLFARSQFLHPSLDILVITSFLSPGNQVINKNVKLGIKKVKASDLEQKVTQDNSHGSAQIPLANQNIKYLNPITFSQKFYQSHALEIAEEYERAIDANSLEKIKILLDNVLEVGENSSP